MGLSQTEMVELLVVSMRTVQNWEGNINKIPEVVFLFLKYSLDNFTKSEILDYLLENRKEFLKETVKMELVMDVFVNMDQRKKIEETNKMVVKIENMIKLKE